MKIIQICPKCSAPGITVKFTVLESVVKDASLLWKDHSDAFACTNSNCEAAYFKRSDYLTVKDIRVKLWYKDNSDDVPICYCSNLTRGEINNAVRCGCQTIDEVQEYTKKNITGKCETENPLGNCCREVFLYTIKNNLSNQRNEKSTV